MRSEQINGYRKEVLKYKRKLKKALEEINYGKNSEKLFGDVSQHDSPFSNKKPADCRIIPFFQVTKWQSGM